MCPLIGTALISLFSSAHRYAGLCCLRTFITTFADRYREVLEGDSGWVGYWVVTFAFCLRCQSVVSRHKNTDARFPSRLKALSYLFSSAATLEGDFHKSIMPSSLRSLSIMIIMGNINTPNTPKILRPRYIAISVTKGGKPN